MKSKPSIKDIANMVGVSTATISRYLNGKYQSMSEETRQRIAAAIERMGYQPSNIARSLRSTKSKTIAVLMADIFNPYSMDVLRGIEQQCSEHGYTIFICDAKDSAQRERNLIEEMTAKGVDGFIINTTGENNNFIKGLSLDYPVVLIGRKINGAAINTVAVDNQQGIDLAMKHLQQKGCRAITFLTPAPGNISPRIERIATFNQIAASEAFREITCHCLEMAALESNALQDRLRRQLDTRPQERQALITANGKLTLHVIAALNALHLTPPHDVLLVGFDDTDWAPLIRQPLTVIAQPTYEIGLTAARKLILMLDGQKTRKETATTLLPLSLIARETT
ncbi:LacI family transcriptional regulator [Paramixta manurensis]|uniref:LacI family transcriptional regulator n=1 Tax=Paramixta manurensis TaxID=2740817 RepID=A0A6M8UKU6_9GAMM|nr:LacI family transcriptional regulator [Erwiniaceae bacterium PD-1]